MRTLILAGLLVLVSACQEPTAPDPGPLWGGQSCPTASKYEEDDPCWRGSPDDDRFKPIDVPLWGEMTTIHPS